MDHATQHVWTRLAHFALLHEKSNPAYFVGIQWHLAPCSMTDLVIAPGLGRQMDQQAIIKLSVVVIQNETD